ncbi:hypothetical protein MTR67_012778, partial [Solanum verrucosum]
SNSPTSKGRNLVIRTPNHANSAVLERLFVEISNKDWKYT